MSNYKNVLRLLPRRGRLRVVTIADAFAVGRPYVLHWASGPARGPVQKRADPVVSVPSTRVYVPQGTTAETIVLSSAIQPPSNNATIHFSMCKELNGEVSEHMDFNL